MAFAKSQLAAGEESCPPRARVFMSLADRDKATGLAAARRFAELGFGLVATSGTAAHLRDAGVEVALVVAKVSVPGRRAARGAEDAVPTPPTAWS